MIRFNASQEGFYEIPGMPIAYWSGEKINNIFSKSYKLSEVATCCTGMQTGNNEKYVRFWFEINKSEFSDNAEKAESKWVKYNCGGESRKWYGNHYKVVLWNNDGDLIKKEKGSVIRNEDFFFMPGISWKRIGGTDFYLRFLPRGFIFDQAGDSLFPNNIDTLYYLLGYVNTKVALSMFNFIAPTLNLTSGNMEKLPVIINNGYQSLIDSIVLDNIIKETTDWDSFETSWDFKKHPLL